VDDTITGPPFRTTASLPPLSTSPAPSAAQFAHPTCPYHQTWLGGLFGFPTAPYQGTPKRVVVHPPPTLGNNSTLHQASSPATARDRCTLRCIAHAQPSLGVKLETFLDKELDIMLTDKHLQPQQTTTAQHRGSDSVEGINHKSGASACASLLPHLGHTLATLALQSLGALDADADHDTPAPTDTDSQAEAQAEV
jgi:hypothetical protein